MSKWPVPEWTKKNPILCKKANRLDWTAWLIAADLAEEAGRLDEAAMLHHKGEVFRAIVSNVEEVRKHPVLCGWPFPLPAGHWPTDLLAGGRASVKRTKRLITLRICVYAGTDERPGTIWKRYDFSFDCLRDPDYLPTRIVNEILA